jgi:hypothetical protein
MTLRLNPPTAVIESRVLRRQAPHAACETRCLCGSLLARLVGDQVELKCRRCKRTTLVPLVKN